MKLWIKPHARINPEVVSRVEIGSDAEGKTEVTFHLANGCDDGIVGQFGGCVTRISLYGEYGSAVLQQYIHDRTLFTVKVPEQIVARVKQ